MFNENFYPTPDDLIEVMCDGIDLEGKVILDPSGGKGNIIDYVLLNGAKNAISCEIHPDLRKILSTKCRVIADDFLTVSSDKVSHIDAIIMNPPFDNGAKHLLHAFEIAPPATIIRCLLNAQTLINPYSKERKLLLNLINNCGSWDNIGDVFAVEAERTTAVEVAFVAMVKPGVKTKDEFEGFFMEEEPEVQGSEGLMQHNSVRELVNRYVAAVKLYDEQLGVGKRMHDLLHTFYGEQLAFTCTEKGEPKLRDDFKTSLQIAGWSHIFSKMNLNKYSTKGLREKINKFVETQKDIPFTMKNIYHMFDMVIQTAGQRMNDAIIEVFDKVTGNGEDSRYYVPQWKTNLHWLLGRKFIFDYMTYQDQRWNKGESRIQTNSGGCWDLIDDMVKAICFATGEKYERQGSLSGRIRSSQIVLTDDDVYYDTDFGYYSKTTSRSKLIESLHEKGIKYEHKLIHEPVYGQWFEWSFFRVKCFKVGTVHFEFLDEELWHKFNRKVAEIKGFQLFDAKEQTAYQKRNAGYTKKK